MSILSSKQMKMIYDYSGQYIRNESTYAHIEAMIQSLKNHSGVDVNIIVWDKELNISSNHFPLVIELLEECRKNIVKRMHENEEKILDVLGIGESKCDS